MIPLSWVSIKRFRSSENWNCKEWGKSVLKTTCIYVILNSQKELFYLQLKKSCSIKKSCLNFVNKWLNELNLLKICGWTLAFF